MMNELMGTDVKVLTEDEILQTFFVDPYKKEEEKNNEKAYWTFKDEFIERAKVVLEKKAMEEIV